MSGRAVGQVIALRNPDAEEIEPIFAKLTRAPFELHVASGRSIVQSPYLMSDGEAIAMQAGEQVLCAHIFRPVESASEHHQFRLLDAPWAQREQGGGISFIASPQQRRL